MIYKDAQAKHDLEGCPAVRLEPCLNCGKRWVHHAGWFCREVPPLVPFSQAPPKYRYLTQSMLDSIGVWDALTKTASSEAVPETVRSPPAVKTGEPDLSDWRNWRSTSADQCPCGIHPQQCTYHRP